MSLLKRSQLTLVLSILIALAIIATGFSVGYWYAHLVSAREKTPASPSPNPSPTPAPVPVPTPVPPAPEPQPEPEPEPEPVPSLNYNIPVLVLKYFPTRDGKIDPEVTGMNEDLAVVKARVNRVTAELTAALEKGSTFHGYKDLDATPSLNYTITKEKEFLTAMPLSGNEIPWNKGIYRPDYHKILTEIGICDYVESKGIKEVWIWGYHHGNLEPAESNMAGPYGDISNSERIMDMPVCGKTYTLYNYNHSRGLAEALEDHTHQIEAVLKYIDNDLFWNKFVQPYGSQTEVDHCGWTHYPPNGRSDYDWYNEEYVWSDCEDWKPDGSGTKKQVNCHTWAGATCNDDGGTAFKIWWMQNIPRSWWDFIADFDQMVKFSKGLEF